MASFLNGLSQAGTGLAEFAGKAGLEVQRSDLAQQQLRLANDLAMTRDTAQNTFTAGEHVLDRAATRGNLEYSETAATGRTDSTNRTSRLNTQDTNATSTANTATNNAGAMERQKESDKAQAERLATTMGGDNTVTIDANTGEAILVNKGSGKVSKILDADGKPVQLPDNDATKALTTSMNVTNEELRTVNLQRAQDVRAAQDDLDKTSQRIDLIGADKDAEIAKRRQALTDIQKRYDTSIAALQGRLAAVTSRLLAQRPSLNGAGGATGDRPPLDSILTTPGASTRATSSGLLNGGGQ